MKRLISSFCLIVLLGVLVVVNAEENITSKEDYYLDFHDEFDGDSLARTNGLVVIFHIGLLILKC
ncbi:hypothetical protein [Streptococcus equi]|uniref:hypothetical protein n=1 Tax=Streptococcus equi TaxID=1336 RepID=UPI001E59CDC0|nr:hypothetical protein [Streptococcus equi]MCD3398070.1 hypothetical protein [Streptococcus equi subsp. zooepidemicus]